MKKNLFALIVLALTFVSFAANPAKMTANGSASQIYMWDSTTYGGHSDTIAATDSITVKSGIVPEIGYEYVLQLGGVSGNGADSVDLEVYLEAFDGTTKIGSAAIDTLSTANTEAILLPFGQVAPFGQKYTVKLRGITGNGGDVVLDNLYIFRRFLVGFERQQVW